MSLDGGNLENVVQLFKTSDEEVLSHADELLQKYSKRESGALDRREKGLRVSLIDTVLENVEGKIAEEESKIRPKQNHRRLARLVEKRVRLEEKRAEIMAVPDEKFDKKIGEVETTLQTRSSTIENRLNEMDIVRAKMNEVQAEIDRYSGSKNPADQLLYAAAEYKMDALTKTLNKLEKEGTPGEQTTNREAMLAEREKAAAMREADHAQEVVIADATIDAYMNEPEPAPATAATAPETEPPKAEEPAPGPAAAPTTEEPTPAPGATTEGPAAQAAPAVGESREVIIDNKIDQMAFDLATMLITNVPNETDTFGKYAFEAKRGLLMIMTFLGSDPAWANQFSPAEQKSLGMTLIPKVDENGNTLTTIKWEPLDLSLNKVQDVYEVAFGENGWHKEMGELTPTTKVKDLQAIVDAFPPDTSDEKQVKMKAFVAALITSGAGAENGVQAYVTENSNDIIEILKPKTATSGTGEASKPEEGAKFNVDNLVTIIGNRKLNAETSFKDAMAAVDPLGAASAEETLTPEGIASKAKTVVEGFTSAEKLTAYQASSKESARAAIKLGLPDSSRAMEATFGKAQEEMKTEKQLSDETKTELQKGIVDQITLVQEYAAMSYYAILEKQKVSATGQDLTDIEKIMAALATK